MKEGITMSEARKIVFIGDSITEWGRFDDDENLGDNYVRLIHDYLKVTYPEKQLNMINKGIGGNRVTDLAARWEEEDRKSTRLNSSHVASSYAVFCWNERMR